MTRQRGTTITRRARLVGAALAVVLLSGCGSTVTNTAPTEGAFDASGDPLAPSSGRLGVPLENHGTAAPGSPDGRRSASEDRRGAAPSERVREPDGAAVDLESAPCGERSAVEVGVYAVRSGDSYFNSAGLSGVSVGDNEAQAHAALADVNGTGGLVCRPVRPVFAYLDAASSESFDVQAQAACERWTQDHRVVAVVNPLRVDPSMLSCLTRRGIPLVSSGLLPWTRRDLNGHPAFVTPGSITFDRFIPAHVDLLERQGFFTAPSPSEPTKVGLIRFDTPEQQDVAERVLAPALRRYGYALDEQYAAAAVGSTRDLGTWAADMQSAVLRFRANGITHVLFFDDGGGSSLFFMTAAENQVYRPRYGLDSHSWPTAFLNGNAPTAQLANSMGTGWNPSVDIDAASEPPLTRTGARCLSAMERAGQDMSNRTTRATAFAYCDGFYFLQAAIRLGGAVSGEGFLRGTDGMGARYVPAATFRTLFTLDRHDGVAAIRAFAFHDACSCFRYTTNEVAL